MSALQEDCSHPTEKQLIQLHILLEDAQRTLFH